MSLTTVRTFIYIDRTFRYPFWLYACSSIQCIISHSQSSLTDSAYYSKLKFPCLISPILNFITLINPLDSWLFFHSRQKYKPLKPPERPEFLHEQAYFGHISTFIKCWRPDLRLCPWDSSSINGNYPRQIVSNIYQAQSNVLSEHLKTISSIICQWQKHKLF